MPLLATARGSQGLEGCKLNTALGKLSIVDLMAINHWHNLKFLEYQYLYITLIVSSGGILLLLQLPTRRSEFGSSLASLPSRDILKQIS